MLCDADAGEESESEPESKDSNIGIAAALLESHGMWSFALQTDPRLHGVPQSRGRIYQ